MTRLAYPTDLSDAQWRVVEPIVPGNKPGGRPPKWTRREILDAILYIADSGDPWRMLPEAFPPWHSVYHYYRLWTQDGTMESILTNLREPTEAAQTVREVAQSGGNAVSHALSDASLAMKI